MSEQNSKGASPAALTDEGAMRVALRIMANLEDRNGVLDGVDDDTKADIADEIAVTIRAAQPPDAAEADGEYKRMFVDAARDMAAIDDALGIDHDDAGGAEPILIAIDDLKGERDAWKAYAEHQEHCAICGEAVSDCDVGSALRDAAMGKEGNGNG